MRVAIAILSLLTLCGGTGCYTKRTLVSEPAAGEPIQPLTRTSAPLVTHAPQPRPPMVLEGLTAEEFLAVRLKERGLPGLPRYTPGTLETTVKLEANAGQSPSSRTIRFIRTGDPSPYIYTVEKTEDGSGWQVTSAFRTDASGKVLRRFPIE